MVPWITPEEDFPPNHLALADPNGLLCAGDDLTPERLRAAYKRGIFPWFSDGQPVLWWSPNPRMVLKLVDFRRHRSLEKVMRRQLDAGSQGEGWQIRVNTRFSEVMLACAQPRDGQGGTWITADIIAAYTGLHRQGQAHSIEVWRVGSHEKMIGGLYGVCLGKMFYGESMFALEADASKTALAWLVRFLIEHGVAIIDCQQNTQHLSFMGAKEIDRNEFLTSVEQYTQQENIVFPSGIQA
jgi:leucyl/phenylalanyl-tRNA---protein transferase